jgi:S1-C subfamily serine protease
MSGIQGAQGNMGPRGFMGINGSPGSRGAQGVTGPGVGSQGVQGAQGVTGPGIGSQGATGSRGTTGVQGVTGSQGVTGVGVQGAQGVTGSQGVTGVGAQGPAGATGSTANIEAQIAHLIDNTNQIPFNLLKKATAATSQIYFSLNNVIYKGSGFFYHETTEDLQYGYFVTAAHCVMSIESNVYYKTNEAYIQNPITNNKWTKIDVNNIFIDGIADIALIRTNIDFRSYPNYSLTISNDNTREGAICYIIGNPGNLDEDSISMGYIRDAHYMEPSGYHITDSIFISAPGIGGNSGGPIINQKCEVIGIYTFGSSVTGTECFGGGSNQDVLKNTLNVLKTGINNKSKLYLGLQYILSSPFTLKNYYPLMTTEFNSEGVYINSISSLSPFIGVLSVGDILLSCTINNTLILFGNKENQRTPGVLLYNPLGTIININFIKASTKAMVSVDVTLNKTYANVSDLLDGPLQTGKNTNDTFPIQINLQLQKGI